MNFGALKFKACFPAILLFIFFCFHQKFYEGVIYIGLIKFSLLFELERELVAISWRVGCNLNGMHYCLPAICGHYGHLNPPGETYIRDAGVVFAASACPPLAQNYLLQYPDRKHSFSICLIHAQSGPILWL